MTLPPLRPTRRAFGLGAASLAASPAFGAEPESLGATLLRIEADVGGRLGVAVLDTQGGRLRGQRLRERFPMCSTFKALAVGALLARVDSGRESLERRARITAADLLANAPVSTRHLGGEMSLAELCEAAVTVSDNTAANQILKALGGPSGVTAFARSLGDETTRLDRTELALNEAAPGDPRDTTSPSAMARTLRALVLGDALSPASRARLTGWLLACRTGEARLRAGLPAGWKVGDKTGTGRLGTSNDIAVVWPPARKPLVICAYLTGSPASDQARDAALAAVGRAVAASV